MALIVYHGAALLVPGSVRILISSRTAVGIPAEIDHDNADFMLITK